MEYIKEHMGEDVSEEEVFEMFREEIYQINKSLPDYKRIRNIIVRKEDFVRTTTKKIKRQANL
jgi:long-chain acyl-CoA synthetase